MIQIFNLICWSICSSYSWKWYQNVQIAGEFLHLNTTGRGGKYPNINFIKGSAIGGGYSDAGAHANVEYYSYDKDEWVMLGIFEVLLIFMA